MAAKISNDLPRNYNWEAFSPATEKFNLLMKPKQNVAACRKPLPHRPPAPLITKKLEEGTGSPRNLGEWGLRGPLGWEELALNV